MKIAVCCPSYKRPKVETLDYLSFCKVYVDEREYNEYVQANKGFEENIIKCPIGVQGNISRVRNYIIDTEFNNGVDVVCIIDDDMKSIEAFEPSDDNNFGYVRKKLEADRFLGFIEFYTNICEQMGFKLWGINCNSDALSYRQYTPFCTTSFIGAPFSCHLKGSEPRYDERIPLKEDYDYTLKHMLKYRGALRVQKYHYNCKQSQQSGGCAMYRSILREKEQFELLQKKWGRDIVRYDKSIRKNSKKEKSFDYNPIIKVPIKGV